MSKFFCVAGILLLIGCRSFYQETGTSITAGDITAPVEISDSSDILTVRALFGMDGMRMWSSRGQNIIFKYDHSYTNSYLYGLVEKKGSQKGRAYSSLAYSNDLFTVESELMKDESER